MSEASESTKNGNAKRTLKNPRPRSQLTWKRFHKAILAIKDGGNHDMPPPFNNCSRRPDALHRSVRRDQRHDNSAPSPDVEANGGLPCFSHQEPSGTFTSVFNLLRPSFESLHVATKVCSGEGMRPGARAMPQRRVSISQARPPDSVNYRGLCETTMDGASACLATELKTLEHYRVPPIVDKRP